jgi:Spy/CpxP family protein refolding chaperone
MKTLAYVITAMLVLGGTGASAQGLPPGGPGEREQFGGRERQQFRDGEQPRPEGAGGAGLGRLMAENFFPAELVMRNQQAIGLREDQQEAIRAEMQKSMARFTDLKWQQSALVETLDALAGKQPVDEKAMLAQFDKLLSLESETKRLHLATLIRVKNILSPEQQAKLRELGWQGRPGPDDRQRRPGGMPPPGAPGR